MNLSRGAIYVAYGEEYFKEAINSARSLKARNDIPCICYCDRDYVLTDAFEKVIVFSDKLERRNHKIQAILDSPFERTLYIDTDTFVCGDLLPAFDVLDRFDIAIAHSAIHFGQSPSSSTEDTGKVPKAFIEFNGGVLFYKSNDVARNVFLDWMKRYNTTSKKLDQPTLREAIYFSNARIYVLPPEYNLTFAGPVFLEGLAAILHGRYGRKNKVMAYSKYEGIAKKINGGRGRRVFIPGLGILSMRHSFYRLKPSNFINGLKRRLSLIFGK